MKSRNLLATLAIGAVFSGNLAAAPITASLDQSDLLDDGVSYLQVTVAEGIDGAIDFTIQVLGPLREFAGSRFGIQSFALNVVRGGNAEAASVTNLPSGWTVRDQYRMGGFGYFDVKLYGGGSSVLNTLTFSISGIDGDRPEDYAVLSTGLAADGHQFFSARVAELDLGGCGAKCTISAYVGGSSAVPLPAAGWLALTAAAAAATRARKRRR